MLPVDLLALLLVLAEVAGGVEELRGHDRRAQPRLGERHAAAALVGAAALEVLAHRRHGEQRDLVAVDVPDGDAGVGVLERHKLHVVSPSSSADAQGRARVDLGGPREPVDRQVLAPRGVHQPRRRAVVDGRHAVARERRGIREPARHVALGHRAEHLGVTRVDRGDQRVVLVDLGAGRGHVDLALDAVLREAPPQAAHHVHAPGRARRPSASSAARARRGRDRCGAACARRASRTRPRSPRR